MHLEWSVAGLLLFAALWPLVSKTRSWGARWGLLFLVVAVGCGAFAWKSRAHNRLTTRQQFLQKLPPEERAGYVRSETCRSCHPNEHASWHQTFHRTMTQEATPAAVLGNFTNVTLTLGGEAFHLSRRGAQFWVEMTDPDWRYVRLLKEQAFLRGEAPEPPREMPPRAEKRVTMTTGSHHMQAYWVAGEFGNQQFSFPFTWLIEEQRWVPRNDVFMLPPTTPMLQQVWNNNCIGCHATAGQPRQDPRTFVIESRVAEYGISCESCHGPGAEHVRVNSNPRRRYALHRGTNGDPTIVNPARVSAKKSAEICGQCHAARHSANHGEWLLEGYDYWHRDDLAEARPLTAGKNLQAMASQPGAENDPRLRTLAGMFWKDGMIRVAGREYNGLVESGCAQRGAMSCLSCHSMHQSDPVDQLARGMEGNAACVQCHTDYAKDITRHTRHAANSSGSSCYNCHMPHTTYGLLKAIRSHQITSPSVQANLDSGRPNACNLCHLDKPLAWTAGRLHEWFGQPIPKLTADDTNISAAATALLRGDAGERALIAWHMGWDAAKQASGTNWLAPYLAETLDDPYSVVRFIGARSLRRLPGFEKFQFDYIAPAAERVRVKSELLQRFDPESLPPPERARVLTPAEVGRLLARRNHRPVELLE